MELQRVDDSLSEIGYDHYGCSHYKRRCKIIAPCCGEIFDCRHCHNESKNSNEVNPEDRHDIPHHDVKRVICSLCSTEQDVQQTCIQCGVCMGRYFCSKCKFFDDDVTKNQYHCDECGICRTGGEENFFHCNKCGKLLTEHYFRCCYSLLMKDSHNYIEKAMHHNCPVCFEFLFDTTKDITVLPCGHTIHLGCVKEMQQFRYSCPVCSKSFCDMSRVWEKLDEEVASTPMPAMYQNKMGNNFLLMISVLLLQKGLTSIPKLSICLLYVSRFGFYAMTVGIHLRLVFILWRTSAVNASPTMLERHKLRQR